MADLFTHVLFGYVIAVVLSWRYEWITYPFITVVMAGAMIPDLSRLELVVPAVTVEAAFGISFSWTPLHRFGGSFLVVCLGALFAPKQYRRAVFALLAVGAFSHYLLDFYLYKPSGLAGAFLWPISAYRAPVEGFYLSSDRWPAAVATALAAVVWAVDRWVMSGRKPNRRTGDSNETTAEELSRE